MWITEATPEQVAELLHNYESALGICGKGSESGAKNESIQPYNNATTRTSNSGFQSQKRHNYFSRPGEAEWGC
jgi:hypothetical protein